MNKTFNTTDTHKTLYVINMVANKIKTRALL